jgi:AraC-like DNA-binding protein
MQRVIEPYLIDIDFPHSLSFVCDLPHSPGRTVLAFCLRTPALVRTEKGIERCEPGDCMVNTPEFPEYERSVPEATAGFRNDWLRCDSKVGMPIVRELGLPCNCRIPTGDPAFLESPIAEIREVLAADDEFTGEAVPHCLWLLFYKLARICRNPSPSAPGLSPSERRYYPRFLDLRARMRRRCAEPLRLDDLARQASLGVERFSVLWQRFFGTTPYADLQEARINAAKRLLVTSDIDIKEIASLCGVSDAFYFSRLFRKRCGVSPREFRRRNGLGFDFSAE